jgi:hypothetical protein
VGSSHGAGQEKLLTSDGRAGAVNELKDEAEPYRETAMETIMKVVATLGASDVDERLEDGGSSHAGWFRDGRKCTW